MDGQRLVKALDCYSPEFRKRVLMFLSCNGGRVTQEVLGKLSLQLLREGNSLHFCNILEERLRNC